MKRIVLFLLISGLIISCSTTKRLSRETKEDNVTVSSGNDASSYENAIVINEKSESVGVTYDIITILTADGVEKEVYFDISKFFGKFK